MESIEAVGVTWQRSPRIGRVGCASDHVTCGGGLANLVEKRMYGKPKPAERRGQRISRSW